MNARRPVPLSCPLLGQTHAVKQEGALRQQSTPSRAGRHCLHRFTSAGGSSYGYPVQHVLSDGQTDHQMQRQPSKEFDNNMLFGVTDRSATKAELQNLFFALEGHKKEQRLALQAVKSEILTQINDLEDRMIPVQRSVQAIQNRCDDQHEQFNHILESAKEELKQMKQDILTTVERSILSKSPPIANPASTAELFPHIPASTGDGLAQFLENSHATDTKMATEFNVATLSFFPPIIEEHEIDLDEKMLALATESGAVTLGAKQLLPPLCMAGKPLEQKVRPQLQPGKALKYIMENYSRLEKAALGHDQSSARCEPLESET